MPQLLRFDKHFSLYGVHMTACETKKVQHYEPFQALNLNLITSTWECEMQRFKISDQCRKNLQDLQNGRARVVITGHQPLFQLGPLFLFHKIFSLLDHCQKLKAKNIPAVPVFWCASEDHDLAEMMKLTRINSAGNLEKITFPQSRLKLAAETQTWTQEMDHVHKRILPPEWRFIAQRFTFTRYVDHFIQMLYEIFAKDGLLVFEAKDSETSAFSFWENIQIQTDHLIHCLSENEKLMTARKEHIQAPRVSPLPVFALHKKTGLRTPLIYQGRQLWQRNGDTRSDHLLNLLKNDERLSPGVLLRPLLTQYLFSAHSCICGPAELKYHQQMQPLYKCLEMKTPCLQPRVSATYLDIFPQHLSRKKIKHAQKNIFFPENQYQERVLHGLDVLNSPKKLMQVKESRPQMSILRHQLL